MRHHGFMKAYSEDLRRKIVQALEKGTSKSEVARAFGVGLSSLKRYVAMAREGRSLSPKKRPGTKPKIGGCVRTRRMAQGRLASSGRRKDRCRTLGVRGRVRGAHLACALVW